jgi:hypothetical protein
MPSDPVSTWRTTLAALATEAHHDGLDSVAAVLDVTHALLALPKGPREAACLLLTDFCLLLPPKSREPNKTS